LSSEVRNKCNREMECEKGRVPLYSNGARNKLT
jgi:hypothetical protein